MSSIIDYTDRATCVIFGDGAGAAVVEASDDPGHRHHRLRELRRWHRRTGAVHAGRRQPAAGVARDRGAAAALREAGRPDGVQVRRAQHRGGLPPHSRPQQDRAVRDRSARLAPGEPAHHPVGGREARAAAREGHHQHREVRQHDGRDDSAGPERRRAGLPPEARRSRAARVGRRRLHGRFRPAQVGTASESGAETTRLRRLHPCRIARIERIDRR